MLEKLILFALVPVYVGIFTGYIAGKCGIVGNKSISDLNSLVTSVAAPVAVFVAVASKSKSELFMAGDILSIVMPVLFVTYLCWYAAARLGAKLDPKAAAVEALAVASPNFAAAGFTVFGALFGKRGAIDVAVRSAPAHWRLLSSPCSSSSRAMLRPRADRSAPSCSERRSSKPH